jgi:peptidoglycan hydrolase-like protein with peptidoglycan-binding domain
MQGRHAWGDREQAVTRRTRFGVAAVGVATVAAIGGVVATSGGGHNPAAEDAPVNTANVDRGALASMVSEVGTLTYRAGADGSPVAVVNRASGIYTELPNGGAEVDCGQVLYRVDDHPVLLLCGTVPAYRDLRRGDVGSDVRQLNQNLHQLGVDVGVDVAPDDDVFTSRTEAALEVLQRKHGIGGAGVVGVADVVYLPWSVRIAELTGQLGGTAQPGAQILAATSNTLEVHVELDASQQEAVEPGDAAQITLPGNTSATGNVARLGRIAKAPAGPGADPGNATIGAYVSLDHPEQARSLDKAPVQVSITTKGVENALSVPVTAIVGRSGGGFAVEVLRDDGRRALVTVRLGVFDTAGGRVQVEGKIREGDHVVVPSL